MASSGSKKVVLIALAAFFVVLAFGFIAFQIYFSARVLPGVDLHYALKPLPHPAVVRTLVALGLTYIGIVLVVGAFDAGLWRQNLAGSLLVLFSAMTTASYFLLGERCIPELGSGGFTIVAMTAAAPTSGIEPAMQMTGTCSL